MYQSDLTRGVSTNTKLLREICSKSSIFTWKENLCDVIFETTAPAARFLNSTITYDKDGVVGVDYSAGISPTLGSVDGYVAKLDPSGNRLFYLAQTTGVAAEGAAYLIYDTVNNVVELSGVINDFFTNPDVRITDVAKDLFLDDPTVVWMLSAQTSPSYPKIVDLRLAEGTYSFSASPSILDLPGEFAETQRQSLTSARDGRVFLMYENAVFNTGSGNIGGVVRLSNGGTVFNYIETIVTDLDLSTGPENQSLAFNDDDNLLVVNNGGTITEYSMTGEVVSTLIQGGNTAAGIEYISEEDFPTVFSEVVEFQRVYTVQEGEATKTEDFAFTGGAYVVAGTVTSCETASTNYTYNTIAETTTGAGSIPAGAVSYSVVNTGTAEFTFNGTVIPATVSSISDDVSSIEGATFSELTYDANGNTLVITYTIKN